jgi:hypothetical protein
MPPVASSICWPVYLLLSGRRWASSRCSNLCEMCMRFMIPNVPSFSRCYLGSHRLQALIAPSRPMFSGAMSVWLQNSSVWVMRCPVVGG